MTTPPDTIAVRVRADLRPVSSVPVLFHRPDGSLVSESVTDEDGRAQVETDETLTVTTALYRDGTMELRSFAGVSPGMLVVVDPAPVLAPPAAAAPRQLDVALATTFTGASGYDINIGCQGALIDNPESIVRFAPNHRCFVGDGEVHVLAGAVDSDRNYLGFAFADYVELSADAPTRIELSNWAAPSAASTLTIRNTTSRSVMVAARDRMVRDGLYFGYYTPEIAGTLSAGGVVSRTYQFPGTFAYDVVETWVEVVEASPDSSLERIRRLRKLGRMPESRTVDLATMVLGGVDSVNVDAGPVVRWSTESGGAPADAGSVRLSWSASGMTYRWDYFFDPAAPHEVRLPELPDHFADAPSAGYDAARVLYVACGRGSYEAFLSDYCPEVGLQAPEPFDRPVTYSYANLTLTESP